jgi:WD40 repeat protein/serine/threonine protein kinase
MCGALLLEQGTRVVSRSNQKVAHMQIGDILNGTYQVEHPLGMGGQARVWQARHLRLPRRFAIKECPLAGADLRERAERRSLFERERDILAALSHPGHPAIPKISDFWEEPDQLFIVLDLVEGETLIELLARRGRVTMPEAINLGRQICEVLTYLHNWTPPIIYRDLSPDNVILDRSGQLHLIDFGIARTYKPGQAQNTSSLGKVGYASPEHLEGGKAQTDVRSDIYTVGALLYHLLTGQEPIPVVDRLKQRAGLQGGRALTPPRSLNHHLTLAIENCIVRAMELEPARRFQTAEELERALQACDLSGRQTPLPLPSERSQQRIRTRPVDPASFWGGTSAPTATPPSLPPHPPSARPWPPEQPAPPNQPPLRGPTSGPNINRGLPPAISGNLGPAPLRRMATGPAGSAPTPAPSGPRSAGESAGTLFPQGTRPAGSGPLPEHPTSSHQAYPGRASGPGSIGTRRPTGSQGLQAPGHILPDLPLDHSSRALVPAPPGREPLPRAPVQRGPLLSRRRLLVGFGVVGVAVVGFGGAAFLLNRARSPYTALFTLNGDSLPVQCVAWSPNSRLLAGGGNSKLIKIWDTRTGASTMTLRGHTDFVQGVAWSNNGINLASASADKTILIWDALQGGSPELTLLGHTDTVYAVAWSPDRSMLASASADQTVRIWDAQHGGQPKQILTGHSDAVYDVAWSPDGELVASASNDGTTKIWDWRQGGAALHSLNSNTGFVRGVSWSPDSKQIASASRDQVVTVWNVDTSFPPAFTLSGPKDVVTSVSWSQDGALLAAGSADHTVLIWDAHQAGPPLNTLTGHSEMITSVAWSPDNTMLASASSDNTVMVWQRQS